MVTRRGLGKGRGKGYRNIINGYDRRVHQSSAKGIKQPQRLPFSNHNTKLYTIVVDYGKPYTIHATSKLELNRHLDDLRRMFEREGENYPYFDVRVEDAKGRDVTDKVFADYDMLRKVTHKDSDGDGVPNHKDCQPFNPHAQDSKIFKVKPNVEIVAEFGKTRNGFKHTANLYVDGQLVDTAKVTYLNRTWESYEFETAIQKLLNKTDVISEAEKKSFLDKQSGKERERVERDFGMIAGIAKMGEIINNTDQERNEWKKRMLKAGVPALDFPEDWDTLSESEKKKRLDNVVEMLGKKTKKKDTDKDGVPDEYDCDPNDPTKQDDMPVEEIGQFTERIEKEQEQIPFYKKVAKLGKKGYRYASDLTKKRIEERKAFDTELENLSDAQLKELAVRHKDTSVFGTGNPYQAELVRRIKAEMTLKDELEKAKKPPQPLF